MCWSSGGVRWASCLQRCSLLLSFFSFSSTFSPPPSSPSSLPSLPSPPSPPPFFPCSSAAGWVAESVAAATADSVEEAAGSEAYSAGGSAAAGLGVRRSCRSRGASRKAAPRHTSLSRRGLTRRSKRLTDRYTVGCRGSRRKRFGQVPFFKPRNN
ncbi:hypothetical protein T492DRAFT_64114 [Pavlovales sp. CCMP2436]|nr:hypothetical protein T492DRAFT_64114 [Pavlovales sp. CCMP2436]